MEMDVQQVTRDIQLQLLKKQIKDLRRLCNERDKSLLFNGSLEPGYLVQTSHGVWEFNTEIDTTNIITVPVSFPYIYPTIYKVETGNTIPKKAEYTIKDVTVSYADQLNACDGRNIYKD